MTHRDLLHGKDETLRCIIDPNDMLLAKVSEQGDFMSQSVEEEVLAELTNYKRNGRLLDWLRNGPQEAFNAFIRSLRMDGQSHVANYIMNSPGDRPLANHVRERLRRVRAVLASDLDPDVLLDLLYDGSVISGCDCEKIKALVTKEQKNLKIIDILMRGSEGKLQCFKDILLMPNVNMAYCITYMEKGEILPIHVELSGVKNSADTEDKIIQFLKLLKIVESDKDKLLAIMTSMLSDDQVQNAIELILTNLKAVIAGAMLTKSVLMFAYCETKDILDEVWQMFKSGQLVEIIQQLFRIFAKDDALSVVISISDENVELCLEGFALSHQPDLIPATIQLDKLKSENIRVNGERMQCVIVLTDVMNDLKKLDVASFSLSDESSQVIKRSISSIEECLQLNSTQHKVLGWLQQQTVASDLECDAMARAELNDVKRQLDSITQCTICAGTFGDPRTLPCIHTYCLKCITGFSRGKLAGDEVPCPLCKKTFVMPVDGLDELPRNFFMEQIKDITCPPSAECEGGDANEAEPHFRESEQNVEDIVDDGDLKADYDDLASVDTFYEARSSSLFTYSSNASHYSKRGKLIIINNTVFAPHTGKAERRGSDIDVAELYSTFKRLGFDINVLTNLTASQMLRNMIKAGEEDHSNYDCLAVAFLSHGVKGILYGTDEPIDIDKLLQPIKYCRSLVGKPKLIFFEGSRGSNLDEGILHNKSRIPVEADFLLAYSTVPGYMSWRNSSKGSWFIQEFCKALNKLNQHEDVDLEEVLMMARHRVAYDYESKMPDYHLTAKKQMPFLCSTLTKKFIFQHNRLD